MPWGSVEQIMEIALSFAPQALRTALISQLYQQQQPQQQQQQQQQHTRASEPAVLPREHRAHSLANTEDRHSLPVSVTGSLTGTAAHTPSLAPISSSIELQQAVPLDSTLQLLLTAYRWVVSAAWFLNYACEPCVCALHAWAACEACQCELIASASRRLVHVSWGVWSLTRARRGQRGGDGVA